MGGLNKYAMNRDKILFLITCLPLELKIKIFLYLPYNCVRLLGDEYFWKLYSNKYNFDSKLFGFSWKSSFLLRLYGGDENLEYVNSMYGSRIYFGRIYDMKYVIADFVTYTGNHKYSWYHIFRFKKDCNHKFTCRHLFQIFVGDFKKTITSEIKLNFLHDWNNNFSLLNNIFRNINIENSKELIYISVNKYLQCKTSMTLKNKCVNCFLNKKQIAIIIPKLCDCFWKGFRLCYYSRVNETINFPCKSLQCFERHHYS